MKSYLQYHTLFSGWIIEKWPYLSKLLIIFDTTCDFHKKKNQSLRIIPTRSVCPAAQLSGKGGRRGAEQHITMMKWYDNLTNQGDREAIQSQGKNGERITKAAPTKHTASFGTTKDLPLLDKPWKMQRTDHERQGRWLFEPYKYTRRWRQIVEL